MGRFPRSLFVATFFLSFSAQADVKGLASHIDALLRVEFSLPQDLNQTEGQKIREVNLMTDSQSLLKLVQKMSPEEKAGAIETVTDSLDDILITYLTMPQVTKHQLRFIEVTRDLYSKMMGLTDKEFFELMSQKIAARIEATPRQQN